MALGLPPIEGGEINMVYVPSDAEWYLADLIIVIRVENDSWVVVHINTVLVHANSPSDAYEKSLALDKEQVGEPYLNPDGKRVESHFIGLKDLSVIHDKLEHGAELFFVEGMGMQQDEILAMLRAREELSVFTDATMPAGPDYSSGKIASDYKNSIDTP